MATKEYSIQVRKEKYEKKNRNIEVKKVCHQ